MRCIVDQTSGLVFNLPNFIINEPLYKKELINPQNIEEMNINVKKFLFIHLIGLLT